MKKIIFIAITVLFISTTASALTLLPGGQMDDGSTPLYLAYTPPNSQSVISQILLDFYGISAADELYKNDYGGGESGSYGDDYTTNYFNLVPDGPSDAIISWDGPDTITDAGYLLVKDGNNTPYWYLYDVGSWNGTDNIVLQGFWPTNGSISHVSIYKGEGSEVPEPATMLLFGAGMAGLASFRLRKDKK